MTSLENSELWNSENLQNSILGLDSHSLASTRATRTLDSFNTTPSKDLGAETDFLKKQETEKDALRTEESSMEHFEMYKQGS